LNVVLAKKYSLIVALIILAELGYMFYRVTPQSIIPKEDIGYFETSVSSPPNAALKYTEYYMNVLQKDVFDGNSNILTNSEYIFSGSGNNFVTMQPWGDKRDESTSEIATQLQQQAEVIPGIKVSMSVPDPVSYGSDADDGDVVLYVHSIGNLKGLIQVADTLLKKLEHYSGLNNVKSSLKFDNSVYNISFNRDLAASVGVDPQNIADTVSVLMSGRHITDVKTDITSYPVKVQMNLSDLSSFDALDKIYVPSSSGLMIPLSNLIFLTPQVRQSGLYRYDRMNTAKITANINQGYSMSEVYQKINQIIDNTKMQGIGIDFGGRMMAYLSSSGAMFGLFLLAIIFIYLVLAAQFESFVDPFIILLTVPLSIIGALAMLLLTGGDLNLFTNIALITLVGLISKHGILITQFANENLKAGLPLLEAIKKGAVTRLRPILMTTLAMVLGTLPLAIATGPGNVSNNMIGWALVGGLCFGTLFSLFVVPVAY
ncbi:MAG: efflux RND transporter permease subunit, partial [Candidatus Puniceispirillaceae bacterium]